MYALIVSVAIGSVAAYIGSLMVTKRMTLMAGALGHLTLPGIAIALKYNFDVSLGAMGILIIGIILIWLLEKRTQLPTEALTAIVFTSSVAIAFLFLPEEKTVPALLGDISQLNWLILVITVVITAALFFIIKHIFDRMILISISRDIAQTSGYSVSFDNFIYLSCIAIIVALGVRIVGGLMTAALIAIPASTSKNVSKSLAQYSLLSMAFGALSCICGTTISTIFSIPIGSAIILSSTMFFVISLIINIIL
jgi:zinc transport system permease protein